MKKITTLIFILFSFCAFAQIENAVIKTASGARVKNDYTCSFEKGCNSVLKKGNLVVSSYNINTKEVHIGGKTYKEPEAEGMPCQTQEPENITLPKVIGTQKSYHPIGIYLEIDNDLVVAKGGTQQALEYMLQVFSQVAILYANEGIEMYLSEVKVWDVEDPYIGPSAGEYLSQFRSNIGGNFNGDLAHLVGTKGGGGVAYVDVLCNKFVGMGYSHIFQTFSLVPNYSWTVNVMTHEIGHNLGAYHTHSCVWNGDNTAIDGCGPTAGYGEGCTAPLPTNGGTIMSYCYLLSGVGINFNNGFGQQPGDLIRSRIAACFPQDTDNDGLNDNVDNCPETPNPTQADFDADGIGDICEDDTDGDGVVDNIDNCLYLSNSNQADEDLDGIGDACDNIINIDDDCDGVVNNQDLCDGGDDSGPCGVIEFPGLSAIPNAWVCGTNKVRICHNGNTICVAVSAINSHLTHGDFLGGCVSCTPQESVQVKKVYMDINGRKIGDLMDAQNGVYLVATYFADGQVQIEKVIKIQ